MIIFESFLTTFEASVIFEPAGLVSKIGLCLKLTTITKFNQDKLVKIRETINRDLKSFTYV